MANSVPDSLTPRKLASVIIRMKASERPTLWLCKLGMAEVMANTPATTDTETVRT